MNDVSERTSRVRAEMTEVLAVRILEHINNEPLTSGTHLSAQELADRFNVSRSPVNRALRLLHDKGVLAHESNRGYFVAQPQSTSPQELGLSADDELSRTYFQISDDRLHGHLPAQVSESMLRERYDLTKANLAAILTRISQEGWVSRRPGYGWEFAEMLVTPDALLQTYRVRMALEPAALLEPGYRIEPAIVERLRTAELRLLDGALDLEPADKLHERGVRFHEAIVGACRNPFFFDSLRRINRVRRLLSYRSMVVRDRYREQCREHLDILGLLEQGRTTEAAEALRAHLVTTIRNLDRIRPLMEH